MYIVYVDTTTCRAGDVADAMFTLGTALLPPPGDGARKGGRDLRARS